MKRLIVLAPGLNGYNGWKPLLEKLSQEDALKGADWLHWDHRKRWYSIARLDPLANELCASIHQQWVKAGPYDDVILVGHSIGGLLVRMAYVLGSGEGATSRQSSPWAARVSRMILFASLSRGIDTDRRLTTRFGNWFGRFFIPARLRLLVSDLFRGSATITNLRIQWIRLMARLGANAPVVVQLLGTRDELVTRDDSIDIEQFPTGYYVSIPGAGHADLHRLDKTNDPAGRYALLKDAFVHERPALAENETITGPSQVVFVVHGIRADNRTWAKETIAAIKARWPHVHSIAPRYEYFSAFKFALPSTRRKNLRWFQDAYAEALARNPTAVFSFIGHSNGTYLFGESMLAIPGMRFTRAALVGTVLPQQYDWDTLLRRGQIESIRVDGSCYDWPVGWLCSALRGLGMKDVGTAGFEGFTSFGFPDRKHEFFWYEGGHSAPLTSTNLPALAEFAIDGTVVEPATLGTEKKWFFMISRLARLLAPIVALIIAAGLIWLAFANAPAAIIAFLILIAVAVILDVI